MSATQLKFALPERDSTVLLCSLGAVLIIAFVPLSASLNWSMVLLSTSLIAVTVARVPLSWILPRGVVVAPALVAALLFLPLLGQGSRLEVLGISMSEQGLHFAAVTALKLIAIMLWLSLLTWKLPPHRLFPAMESIYVPSWLIQILRSTYLSLAVLGREVASMRQALRSRILHPGVWLVGAAGNMVSLLFLRTQRRAGSQVVARESRCHVGGLHYPEMADPSIQIANVSYRYSGGDTNALHAVCLDIPAQAKVAILGSNGAGKTTLLLHLNGVIPIQSGSITVGGTELDRSNVAQIRQQVGMLFQNPDDQILGLTVEEDVAIGPNQLKKSDVEKAAAIDAALRAVGLTEKRSQPPHQLSGGQRKRLALAGVLASGAQILLLDEPMASLDPPGRDEVAVLLDDLHRDGRTIIAATHDVDFAAEWANMVVLMDGGRVVAVGSPQLLTQAEIMASAGLCLPRVSQPIADLGARKVPFTSDGVVEWIKQRLGSMRE